jgi:MFS family permease
MATFTIAFAASQMVGPVATGWVADRFGSLRPGLTASAMVLALGALLALAQRDLRGAPGASSVGVGPPERGSAAHRPGASVR